MPTPHNNAKKGDIARTVLMPGDPLRAKFIAENYLDSPACYNEVRGMLGFTGTYKGVPVSVQGSGMGMPSIGIYSWELFNEYGVENIIRVGTAGAVADNVDLRDVVIGMSASTNSAYASQYRLPGTVAPTASFELLKKALDQMALFIGIPVHGPRSITVLSRRNDIRSILRSNVFTDRFGTVCFVSKNIASLNVDLLEQWNSMCRIVIRARRQHKSQRIAQAIHQSMNLRISAASGHSDSFIFSFFPRHWHSGVLCRMLSR